MPSVSPKVEWPRPLLKSWNKPPPIPSTAFQPQPFACPAVMTHGAFSPKLHKMRRNGRFGPFRDRFRLLGPLRPTPLALSKTRFRVPLSEPPSALASGRHFRYNPSSVRLLPRTSGQSAQPPYLENSRIFFLIYRNLLPVSAETVLEQASPPAPA